VNAKKIAGLVGVALVIFFVISQPANSAGLVTSIVHWLRTSAESVIAFVSTIFKG
jgi:hypothetical protein